jgi:hypothetical protein
MARKARTSHAGKLDLVRERPEYFHAKRVPELVELGPAKYLAIEGAHSPESPEFQNAIDILYRVAYGLKTRMRRRGHDYRISNLEGQWWSDYEAALPGDPEALWLVPRDAWRWRLLLMVPDFVAAADVENTKGAMADDTPEVDRVRLVEMEEGLCAQILHVGPYAAEPQSIARMRDLMMRRHLKARGLHHEVYLGDPRRTPPDRLRTAIRQPVEPA